MTLTANEFFKKAISNSEYFGFRSSSDWQKQKACLECNKNLDHSASASDRRLDGVYGLLTNGINIFTKNKLHAVNEPIFHYSLEQTPRSGEVALALHIFGVEKSIAEAILIQTIRSLFYDLGFEDHTVKINSLGDNDSIVRYTRELNTFFRKRINDLPPTARELMKEHSISALMHLLEKRHDIAYESPNSLEFLNDQSRRHFREIIEYLDMSDTSYEIDPKLIGHHKCYHSTIFSFDVNDKNGSPLSEQPLLVRGGRFGNFMEHHLKQTQVVPAVGAVVIMRGKSTPVRFPKSQVKRPIVHLAQIGFAPKIRSLLLINELRHAGVMVDQDLSSDSLSSQLQRAEEGKVKYTIIIGQKEYVDKTVILRDMVGKNQEIIPVADLVLKLRKIGVAL